MSETIGPETICSVPGCQEPAVVTPRSPAAADVVESPPGEIVPLCAAHAEQANTPPEATPES